MEKNYELKYHNLENSHWWFKARRNFILQIVSNFSKNSRILDIGCSGGVLIKELNNMGFKETTGIDKSKRAIDLCKKRKIPQCYLMDASNLKFKKKFDVIIASDVLEHIQNDKKTIEIWKEHLSVNGKLICFVPAFQFLWSHHDVANQHFRRYNKLSLANLFKSQTMEIERVSYWNFSLFTLALIIRTLQKFLPSNQRKHQLKNSTSLMNNFLIHLLNLENKFLKHFSFPVGISVFLIAKNIN